MPRVPRAEREPGPGGVPPRGLAERVLRFAQRALLGAMMTVAAAVAERRIRRALRGASPPVLPGGITPE
jgi:hypothetical protein